ncbi:MAG: hypothetical protein AB1744_08155, partial [Candidatus Zixiibacteriota bacterium]
MERVEAIKELERIYQEYTDDIGEFWDFARWVSKAASEAKKVDAELEQRLPDALGSLKYNPQQ